MISNPIFHLQPNPEYPYLFLGLAVPTVLIIIFYAYWGMRWLLSQWRAILYFMFLPFSKWVELMDRNGVGTDEGMEQQRQKGFSWQPRDS